MTAEIWVLVWMGLLQFVLVMLHGTQIALSAGVGWGTGRRDTPPPPSDLGRRIDRSLHNGLESLSIYTPLAIGVHVADLSSPLTQSAAAVYLAARLAFALIYLANIPRLRTIAWFIGNAALVALAWPLVRLASGQ